MPGARGLTMATARRSSPRGPGQRQRQRRAWAQLRGAGHPAWDRTAPAGPRRPSGPAAWPPQRGSSSSRRPGSPKRCERGRGEADGQGRKKSASEERDHITPENMTSSTQECLAEAKEKETKLVIKNIEWTTAKNFTVETGQEQIEELISTWDVHESWLHHSEFLKEEELKDSKQYHYRACWGIPTRRKPIPRATASVYFVIVISKFKPDTAPVEVFYRLESSRLIRRPEQCQFREKWLKDIIENKIACLDRLASR